MIDTQYTLRNHTKMLQYRFVRCPIVIFFLLQTIAIQRTQQGALDGNYVNDLKRISTTVGANETQAATTTSSPHNGLESPLIILMSSDSISVAQLPMILYGNVSEIYRLSQDEQEPSDRIKRPSSDDEDRLVKQDGSPFERGNDDSRNRRKLHQEHADAREYEQMPHQATPTVNMTTTANSSLGKSEWQQIAAGERDREEVGAPQPTAQTNMNRKNAREETGDSYEEKRQLGHPRRRRSSSNSLRDGDSQASNDGGAEPEASATSSDAQTLRRVNRALESSLENVTSAQSDGQQLSLALEGAGAGSSSASTEEVEEGDKTIPSVASHNRQGSSSDTSSSEKRVQFSDFDVHMALGYAFAADTTGRIHRFRLPLSEKETAKGRLAASLTNNQNGWRIVSNDENSAANENYDANAIYDGVKSQFSLRQSKESGVSDHRRDDHSNFSTTETTNSVSVGARNDANNVEGREIANRETRKDSNDVNKVGQGGSISDVTHEQSGSDKRQHPTISGGQNALASAHEIVESGPPISVGSQTLDQQLVGSYGRRHLERGGAEPRVIWSRNERSRTPLTADPTHPKASSVKQEDSSQREQLASARGALTTETRESNQLADEGAKGGAGDQSQQQSAGGSQNDDGASDENQSEQSSGACAKQPTMAGRRKFRTEVAVDWLNNLLFVLDKCRLLVMDLEGNNELVLIDDFTEANRPIEIKVDPINDFLFWLQVGKFHNTIYKLDLSVLAMPSATQKLVSNALRLRQSLSADDNGSSFDASDLVPLVSHHYAHPIITNLPRETHIFTIDHKHSRIYVPLVPPSSSSSTNQAAAAEVDLSKQDEAEVFASTGDATHLNNTQTDSSLNDERNCSQNSLFVSETGQILAYNLDGTDVGPFRAGGERSYISNLDSMQDLTLDSKNNLLYWLTNGGKDLFEEFKESSTIQPAQHFLSGKSYSKLIYFDNEGFSQPTTSKSRFNVRKIIHILSSSISSNRPTRSDGIDQVGEDSLAFSLKVRHLEVESMRFSRNTPYIILGVTCLLVVTVYLVYALIFQDSHDEANDNAHQCQEGSMHSDGSSSIGGSHVESNINGFINSNTISRWIAGPSVRSVDTSTFNRDVSSGNGAYDIESTNYEASNAIDEHYRDRVASANQLCDLTAGHLANLTEWPTNMHDRSNKLYVPVEVLQDDALASIRRVSIDQLEIEKTAPLGEGHFGTVLQGKIKCTLHERTHLLDKSQMNITFSGQISPDSLAPNANTRIFGISSASSGHGSSSSASCEFATANSCIEPTNDEDYLTPKNQLNSASSDYCADAPHSSLRDDSCIDYSDPRQTIETTSKVSTKLMVAIKKLKDNASADEKRDFLQEAKLLANFDHPNIVHLIGICLDRGSTLIVMELMLGGDLIRYMQENTPTPMNHFADSLTYDDLLKVCLDIANGCCYLEDLDYIHRDLAARNCLVSSRKREERVVKLADFGLARDIYKDSYYKKLNDSAMPLKWMAPECLIEQKFTKKSDVWSYGVVMWEVMSYCQEKPYVGVEPFFMKEHLASGGRLRKPDHCDESMYRLMNQCWQMRPEDRPTFHECRAMLIEIRNNSKQ